MTDDSVSGLLRKWVKENPTVKGLYAVVANPGPSSQVGPTTDGLLQMHATRAEAEKELEMVKRELLDFEDIQADIRSSIRGWLEEEVKDITEPILVDMVGRWLMDQIKDNEYSNMAGDQSVEDGKAEMAERLLTQMNDPVISYDLDAIKKWLEENASPQKGYIANATDDLTDLQYGSMQGAQELLSEIKEWEIAEMAKARKAGYTFNGLDSDEIVQGRQDVASRLLNQIDNLTIDEIKDWLKGENIDWKTDFEYGGVEGAESLLYRIEDWEKEITGDYAIGNFLNRKEAVIENDSRVEGLLLPDGQVIEISKPSNKGNLLDADSYMKPPTKAMLDEQPFTNPAIQIGSKSTIKWGHKLNRNEVFGNRRTPFPEIMMSNEHSFIPTKNNRKNPVKFNSKSTFQFSRNYKIDSGTGKKMNVRYVSRKAGDGLVIWKDKKFARKAAKEARKKGYLIRTVPVSGGFVNLAARRQHHPEWHPRYSEANKEFLESRGIPMFKKRGMVRKKGVWGGLEQDKRPPELNKARFPKQMRSYWHKR